MKGSAVFSQLSALTAHSNATLQINGRITAPYATSPLYTSIPKLNPTTLGLQSTMFSRIASSVISGTLNLNIRKCVFQNSIRPLALNAGARSSYKTETVRRVFNSPTVTIYETNFDYCSSSNENGGSVKLEDCTATFENVDFIRSTGLSAGALLVEGGVLRASATNFVRCKAKKAGGAVIAQNADTSFTSSYFVNNDAVKSYGVGLFKSGFASFSRCFFYDNSAQIEYGCLGYEDITGDIVGAKFNNNKSPVDKGGTSFYLKSVRDTVILEHSTFGGPVNYYIKYKRTQNFRLQENCFDIDPRLCTLVDDPDPGMPVVAFIGNNLFKDQCPAPPKLPQRFQAELFYHPAVAPKIEWWKLYLSMGIFILMIGIMAFSIPSIFFPYYTQGGIRRGEAAN